MTTLPIQALSSELNLFEQTVIQTGIQKEMDIPISPLATLQQGAPIEFEIEPVPDLYADLNNSKLEIIIKLTKADGSNLDANDHVGVVNLLLHSIFINAEMELDNKRLSDCNNLYPYKCLIESLLNYPSNVLDTRMICEGWKKDTSGQMNVTDPTGANAGLTGRSAPYAESRLVRLIGRPHLDLFHQLKLVPTKAKIKIRFIPNKHAFILKTAAPANGANQVQFKAVINSATLYVRMKQISSSLRLAHEKMAMETNYLIPYTKVLMKKHTISTGTSNTQIENLYTGPLPYRIALVLVHDQAVNGSYTANPFDFQHFNLTYISIRVNGEQVPRRGLEPSFRRADYFRDYTAVLESLGYDVGPETWALTPSEWANGYTVYVFKTAPVAVGPVRSAPLSGVIGLELKFAAATTHNINIILLAEHQSLVEIDSLFRYIG